MHAKSSMSSEPKQEVVYEDEYEYDDEEGSYEYDDEVDEEDNHKSTVKRTAMRNSSESEVATRSRRDIPAVREERYVPNHPLMNQVEYSQTKPGQLQMYASYFVNPLKHFGSSDRSGHLSIR